MGNEKQLSKRFARSLGIGDWEDPKFIDLGANITDVAFLGSARFEMHFERLFFP